MPLSNEDFLQQVKALLGQRTGEGQESGSVFMTQKPMNTAYGPACLLVRATDGRGKKAGKVKLSTLVAPHEMEAFFAAWTRVGKEGMSHLRKKERKEKRKKKPRREQEQ